MPRTTFIALTGRNGKAGALNRALQEATEDIVVFTDASIMLAPDAIHRIVQPFTDPRVGCVSGEDRIEGAGGEGLYGRYELFVRRRESEIGSIVGASGSFYAQRRHLCEPFVPNLAPDFWSVLRVVEQGYRAISEPTAVGSMTHVSSMTDEFTRKVRTLLRGITTLWRYAHLMNPFAYGFFAVQLLSHKLARWLVPFFLAGALIASAVLAPRVAVVRGRARGPGRALPAGPRRPRRGAALRRLAARPHRLLLHRRQRRHAGRLAQVRRRRPPGNLDPVAALSAATPSDARSMSQPQRIVYVEGNTDGTIGGSYFSLLFLVQGLDRRRYEPVVVFQREHTLWSRFERTAATRLVPKPSSFGFATRLRRAGWPGPLLLPLAVLQSGLNALLFLVTAARYAGVLRRERADLLHLNNSITRTHDWMLAARLAGIPCIVHERGINDRFPFPTRQLAPRLAAILCISRAAHDNLLAHGFGPGNLHTIPNGLDPGGSGAGAPGGGRPRRARPGAGPPGHRRRRQHPPVEGPGDPDPRAAGDPGARARRRLRARRHGDRRRRRLHGPHPAR